MYPDYEQLIEIAKSGDYGRIPVCRELFADCFTPIEVMRTIRAASRHCYLLESADDSRSWGRFSFLGYAPALEITCTKGTVHIRTAAEEGNGTEEILHPAHPKEVFRKILSRFKSPRVPGMPPFTGGLVGYFSYDYIQYGEPTLKLSADSDETFQDADFMLFDKVIAFDNYRQKVILITGVDPNHLEASCQQAQADLDEMEQLLRSNAKAVLKPLHLKGELTPRYSRERYCQMVEETKHYIHEGDIFQAVISNPLEAEAEGSLFDTYRVLRTTNPSPYMFYFSSDDIEIAGASPETLVNLKDGILHTFPLAGTRPRGATPDEDQALAEELLQDQKELAEHNMLVDLGRNDIGKLSRLGSVQVEQHCQIQYFSHVMHIASSVSGKIAPDKDALDAVDAILPAGTLSGAPKLRACEIIQELEQHPRGIYGGAIGYLDFTGNLDVCIAIRLAYKKHGRICVQSGAGIVADSIPEKEYDECQNKAKAVINALLQAEGGIL